MFFYYLRKKVKYDVNCAKKFTTTDSKFHKMVMSLYSSIPDCDSIDASQISSRTDIIDVIKGSSLGYGISWSLVDHVLIPIWLGEDNHWVLAIFNIADRTIRVCNTFWKDGFEAVLKNALLPLSKLLPHFLVLTDFYKRTDVDFSAHSYAVKKKTECIKSVFTRFSTPRCNDM